MQVTNQVQGAKACKQPSRRLNNGSWGGCPTTVIRQYSTQSITPVPYLVYLVPRKRKPRGKNCHPQNVGRLSPAVAPSFGIYILLSVATSPRSLSHVPDRRFRHLLRARRLDEIQGLGWKGRRGGQHTAAPAVHQVHYKFNVPFEAGSTSLQRGSVASPVWGVPSTLPLSSISSHSLRYNGSIDDVLLGSPQPSPATPLKWIALNLFGLQG